MSTHRPFAALPRWAHMVALLGLVGLAAGCSGVPAATQRASTPGATCAPTDQDQFVWDPGRLQVEQPCVYVTGRIDALGVAPDGDSNTLLHLDPPYQHLLAPANSVGDEHGDLDVEAVCAFPPVWPEAIALCASDPDPYARAYPPVGAHVWMAGRYVLDLDHGGHAELHPLYRMGTLSS